MPWTRAGDSAATYPKLMSVMGQTGADERAVNEVAGFLFRCAAQSAMHMTDYVVDVGTAWMLGGSRTQELVALATRAGLITPSTLNGAQAFKVIDDPEFIHIRLRKEVEWERQQRKDTRDPRLRAPVLHRDGDNCRWCGVRVHWRGKTTNRTGTLDHLRPGDAGTVDTMVVACKGCNGARQDNPQWDDDHQLRDPPKSPNYGKITAADLTENGYPTEPNYGTEARTATAAAPDTAPTQDVRPAAAPGANTQHSRVPLDSQSTDQSQPSTDSTTDAGTGRDGSGLGRAGEERDGDGTGQVGAGRDGSQPPRRRRGRRGRRRKPGTS